METGTKLDRGRMVRIRAYLSRIRDVKRTFRVPADADLTPKLGEPFTDVEALRDVLTDAPPPSERDASTPRLLRVLLDRPLVRVTLVTDGPITGWTLSTRDGHRWPLTPDPTDTGRNHQLTADADLAAGVLCYVQAEGQPRLGPVRATDPDDVTSRPGPRSPLEDAGLDRVLADARLSERLFEALKRHAAAGRLDLAELERRVEAIARAVTREEASAVMADLPPLGPRPGAAGRRRIASPAIGRPP